VGVDEVDAEALEPLQALSGALVAGPRGADLGVVERDGGKVYTTSVEVEVAPLDPQLAEAKPGRVRGVGGLAARIEERQASRVGVPRRVQIPQPGGLPRGGEAEPAFAQIGLAEGLARELDSFATLAGDLRPEGVSAVGRQVGQAGLEGDLPPAHRGVDLRVVEPRPGGRALEPHIATEPAAGH